MARQLDELKRALLAQYPSVLQQWFPEGHLEGRVFMIGNLNGDRGKSLKVNPNGQWKDWATGESGSNLLDLYAQHRQIKITEAYDALAPAYGLNGAASAAAVLPVKRGPGRPRKVAPPPPAPEEVTDIEMPTEAAPPVSDDPSVRYFEYRDIADRLLFVVYRKDYPRGKDGKKKKDVHPKMYGTKYGQRGWWGRHPPSPKPLYNVKSLVGRKLDRGAFVVSGEKCVEAMRPTVIDQWKHAVVTWPGGDNHVQLADWSPLTGRKVWYWPDNDKSGRESVPVLVKELEALGATVKIIRIPPDVLEQLPEEDRKGADAANLVEAGLFTKELLARLVSEARPYESPPPVEAPELPEESVRNAAEGTPPPLSAGLPIPLGMLGGRAAVLDRRGPEVVYFSRSEAGRKTLQHCAAIEDWERSQWTLPGRGGGLITDWDKAAGDYIAMCLAEGPMPPDRVRGKGVYMDAGRVVANLAREGLIVDGELVPAGIIDRSRHYYITSGDWVPRSEPMKLEEAGEIAEMICRLRWADPFYGVAFAGWLAVAPITGTLPWRANLWISGQSGTGKSFTMNSIAKALLEPVVFHTQGSTTEAGVRQALSQRAVPVLWDEFEAESDRDNKRRQSVLELVRNSTQGAGGEIHKGASGGGSGMRYFICASWMFASVNTQQRMRADVRRTLTIEIAPPALEPTRRAKEVETFAEIERKVRGWDANIGARWVWRSVAMVRAIAKTRDLIIDKMVSDGAPRSVADQMACLLSGYWSLLSDHAATPEQVAKLIETTYGRWLSSGTGAGDGEDISDELTLLQTMLDMQVSVTLENEADRPQTQRLSLRELVEQAVGLDFDKSEANKGLSRFGLRVSGDYLLIANTHPELAKLMADTPWAGGWNQILRRLPGARTSTPRRFLENGMLGENRRGTEVPLRFCGIKLVPSSLSVVYPMSDDT